MKLRRMSKGEGAAFALGILVAVAIAFSALSSSSSSSSSEKEKEDADNAAGVAMAGKFAFRSEPIARGLGSGKKFFAEKEGGNVVTYSEAMGLLRDADRDFEDAFLAVLRSSTAREQRAYFFETPACTLRSAESAQFEFVLNDASSSLGGVAPDEGAFREHFGGCADGGVAAFFNLGRDAKLVAPCPDRRRPAAAFAHLAGFVRGADDGQVRRLWRTVGREMLDRLHRSPDRRTWLSTSGLGVYWLHVRLDSYPKYYTYRPYKQATG